VANQRKTMTTTMTLPNVAELAHARLPEAYQAAKLSLANCAKLDITLWS
jgi:hypothetical protein